MTLELEQVRVQSKYSVEIVDGALLTYAATGNYEQAADITGVPKATIIDWCRRFPNRLQHQQQTHQASIEKALASKVRQNVLNASTVLEKAIALEEERIDAGDVKDSAASARNMATVIGIGVDKILTLEGRPTQITEHRSGAEALRQLEARGLVIESTAEEVA